VKKNLSPEKGTRKWIKQLSQTWQNKNTQQTIISSSSSLSTTTTTPPTKQTKTKQMEIKWNRPKDNIIISHRQKRNF